MVNKLILKHECQNGMTVSVYEVPKHPYLRGWLEITGGDFPPKRIGYSTADVASQIARLTIDDWEKGVPVEWQEWTEAANETHQI